MPRINFHYGKVSVPTGLFLPRTDGLPHPKLEYIDLNSTVGRHLSTFPVRSTIKEAVLDTIRNAQRHVFFANFLIQDEDVVESLLRTAKRLNGHVYVLTTLKADDFTATLQGENGIEGDFQAHIRCVERLSQEGLLVKARSDCHAKFLTVDDEAAIVTSANAVPTCYGNVQDRGRQSRAANPENGVLLTLRPEVLRLANFFRAMWRSGCNYYVSPGSGVFKVHDLQDGHPVVDVVEPNAPTSEGETLWTAPGDLRILNRLVRMLGEAKRKVALSSWVVKGMDGHVFGNALRDATARGVDIRLLVRGMNKRDDLREQCYRLKKVAGNRLHIVGDYWNHSKAIVVDDREAMLMTANLDAQHGLDSGVEVGFWSSSPTFVSAVDRFLNRLFDEAAFSFDIDLPQATVEQRYGKQKEPRLAGSLRLKMDSRSSYKNEAQVRRWCQELEQQLVRVASRRHNGQEQMLILTDFTAAYCTRANNFIRVLRIEDKPSREVASRFSSYLGESDIVVEWG